MAQDLVGHEPECESLVVKGEGMDSTLWEKANGEINLELVETRLRAQDPEAFEALQVSDVFCHEATLKLMRPPPLLPLNVTMSVHVHPRRRWPQQRVDVRSCLIALVCLFCFVKQEAKAAEERRVWEEEEERRNALMAMAVADNLQPKEVTSPPSLATAGKIDESLYAWHGSSKRMSSRINLFRCSTNFAEETGVARQSQAFTRAAHRTARLSIQMPCLQQLLGLCSIVLSAQGASPEGHLCRCAVAPGSVHDGLGQQAGPCGRRGGGWPICPAGGKQRKHGPVLHLVGGHAQASAQRQVSPKLPSCAAAESGTRATGRVQPAARAVNGEMVTALHCARAKGKALEREKQRVLAGTLFSEALTMCRAWLQRGRRLRHREVLPERSVRGLAAGPGKPAPLPPLRHLQSQGALPPPSWPCLTMRILGVLQSKIFIFTFKSDQPGIFEAAWSIDTHPKLEKPADPVVLRGISTSWDTKRLQRRLCQADMTMREKKQQVRRHSSISLSGLGRQGSRRGRQGGRRWRDPRRSLSEVDSACWEWDRTRSGQTRHGREAGGEGDGDEGPQRTEESEAERAGRAKAGGHGRKRSDRGVAGGGGTACIKVGARGPSDVPSSAGLGGYGASHPRSAHPAANRGSTHGGATGPGGPVQCQKHCPARPSRILQPGELCGDGGPLQVSPPGPSPCPHRGGARRQGEGEVKE